LEFKPIPKDPALRKILNNNTSRLSPIGCSAALIGDSAGAVTARHCGFRWEELSGAMLRDDSGAQYLVSPPITASTGDTQSAMRPAIDGRSVILPAQTPHNSSLARDTAILVDKDSSPQKAFEAYSAMRLSSEEIRALPPGTQLVMSGWPSDQKPKSQNGTLARQEFTMTVLGTTIGSISNGDQIEILVAAMEKNENNAVCSFGGSGSQAYAYSNGEWRGVGELAWFRDLNGTVPNGGSKTAAAQWRTEYTQRFRVNLSSADALCGFSLNSLRLGSDTETYRIVPNRASVPGYEGPASDMEAPKYYADLLADPNEIKQILNGQISLQGKGAALGASAMQYTNRPVVSYNRFTGQVTVISYNSSLPHGIDTLTFNTPGDVLLQSLGHGTASIMEASGAIVVDKSVGKNKGFITSSGLSVGFATNNEVPQGTYYNLAVSPNGQLEVKPLTSIG
jgi:hypothetical protein